MKRFLFWLGLMFSLGQSAFSQIPGYLGKRMTLAIQSESIFALQGPTANNRGQGEFYGDKGGGFAVSWRAGLTGGYAVSRSTQVLAGVDYLKTGMISNVTTPYFDQFNFTEFTDEHYLFYNLDVKTANIGFRKFNPQKGALAPFGNYFGMFFDYSLVKGKILDKRTYLQDADLYNRTEHTELGIDPKFNYFALGVEFGENFIIKDRLLLNVGARLRVPLQLSRVLEYDGYNLDNQGIFEKDVVARLGLHSLFTINIGFGILL
jgi:hypothetical protein